MPVELLEEPAFQPGQQAVGSPISLVLNSTSVELLEGLALQLDQQVVGSPISLVMNPTCNS